MTDVSKPVLDTPIVILGAARSGTTMLGELLSRHPDVAYWIEPKYVWRYGNPRARSDVRTATEATSKVRTYIRSKFANYASHRGKHRFMDKTPSNCFRVPFVHEVLPEARYIHLVRDGRDVAFSARIKWATPPDKSALWRRAVSFEIPLKDAPHYAIDFVRDVVGRQLLPKQAFIWGPHFPGIREVREQHSLLETCAIQWRESYRAVREGLRVVPREQVCTVRFETLLQHPEASMAELCRTLGLEERKEVYAHAREHIDTSAGYRWKAQPAEELAQILPLISDELHELGYVGSQATEPLLFI